MVNKRKWLVISFLFFCGFFMCSVLNAEPVSVGDNAKKASPCEEIKIVLFYEASYQVFIEQYPSVSESLKKKILEDIEVAQKVREISNSLLTPRLLIGSVKLASRMFLVAYVEGSVCGTHGCALNIYNLSSGVNYSGIVGRLPIYVYQNKMRDKDGFLILSPGGGMPAKYGRILFEAGVLSIGERYAELSNFCSE